MLLLLGICLCGCATNAVYKLSGRRLSPVWYGRDQETFYLVTDAKTLPPPRHVIVPAYKGNPKEQLTAMESFYLQRDIEHGVARHNTAVYRLDLCEKPLYLEIERNGTYGISSLRLGPPINDYVDEEAPVLDLTIAYERQSFKTGDSNDTLKALLVLDREMGGSKEYSYLSKGELYFATKEGIPARSKVDIHLPAVDSSWHASPVSLFYLGTVPFDVVTGPFQIVGIIFQDLFYSIRLPRIFY